MFVGEVTANPLTVPETMPVQEAEELAGNIRSAAAGDQGDKLVGIVTEIDILQVTPSSATHLLSVFEHELYPSRLPGEKRP